MKKELEIELIPDIANGAKLVLPISMNQYDGNAMSRKEIVQKTDLLLQKMAEILQSKKVVSVDVICTAGLNDCRWDAEKISEIENFFFKTHAPLLNQLS